MDADIIEIAEYLEANQPKKLLDRAINDGATEGFVVDLNTRGQLGKFEDSTGKKLADIGGEYSEFTQEMKLLGPREVNLNDEDDYWNSFELESEDGDMLIDSDPIKDGESLENRWGKNLEGLQPKNLEKAYEFIDQKIWEQAGNAL